MFVAWRDIRFARGRFLLIGAVVTLITLLVGFLSGLTAGLAQQNISAVTSLTADRIVFSEPTDGSSASWSSSQLSSEQESAWEQLDGVSDAAPLGVSRGKVGSAQRSTDVAFFGVTDQDLDRGSVELSAPAAEELGAAIGDTVTIGTQELVVSSVGADDWYSHVPVVWMQLADWQEHAHAAGLPDAHATVLLVSGSPDEDVPGTVSNGLIGSLMALETFSSEIGSLLTMVAMLFGISALVIGAFFTVWTIQRSADIAVLKALGASQRSLLRDALGQALVVLAGGVFTGFALTAVLGSVAGQSLPFVLSPLTTLLPAGALIVLGLAGAAFALRVITRSDPLTALGSNR